MMADEVRKSKRRDLSIVPAPQRATDGTGADVPPAAVDASLPTSVTLDSLYSYYGDDGLLRTWSQGLVVTDPLDIADLIARGAPLKG
jgi:hypothetical protein